MHHPLKSSSVQPAPSHGVLRLPKPGSRQSARARHQPIAHAKPRTDVDAIVVGAGIIGLLTAQSLLKQGLSVALVERKQLCAGATGAGQGYVWMAHRSPSTALWELASTSVHVWKQLVKEQPALASCIEWQDTGSMLVAAKPQEAAELQRRQAMLQEHGIEARYLGPDEARAVEPSLAPSQHQSPLGEGLAIAGALMTQSDAQINGRQTAHHLLNSCKAFPGLHLLLDEPVEQLLLQPGGNCTSGVETSTRIIGSRRGTVVAAGVWSGQLLSEAMGNPHWAKQLQPRRGHLLELPRPEGMPVIKHGMMEMSYTKHYSARGRAEERADSGIDITFTATTSASGSLLVGSSREFSGWDAEPSPSIVQAIMDRAALFLPHLRDVPPPEEPDVRVGLRPYATGGAPLIGPVPGAEGLFLAAGHEGSGLCLGPATAQLLSQYMLGEGSGSINADKFKDLLPPAAKQALS